MKRWEYCILAIGRGISRQDEQIRLDKLGHQGWELVSSIMDTESTAFHYFKRPFIK